MLRDLVAGRSRASGDERAEVWWVGVAVVVATRLDLRGIKLGLGCVMRSGTASAGPLAALSSSSWAGTIGEG